MKGQRGANLQEADRQPHVKGRFLVAINASNALLLEDEPLICMELESILRTEGFDVTTAMSCLDANAWLDHHRPDVAIVDIELRDGPCTAVINRLIDANIPFVVHTGDSRSFHIGTPYARGAWVGKPAAPDELILALKLALSERDRIPAIEPRATEMDLMTTLSV